MIINCSGEGSILFVVSLDVYLVANNTRLLSTSLLLLLHSAGWLVQFLMLLLHQLGDVLAEDNLVLSEALRKELLHRNGWLVVKCVD